MHIATIIEDVINQKNETQIFCPAIYDLKSSIADIKPEEFGQWPQDMHQALAKELNDYKLKWVTSAYDIYNVEVEALGALIQRKEGLMPEVKAPLLNDLQKISELRQINHAQGRMDLFVKSAQFVMSTKMLQLAQSERISGNSEYTPFVTCGVSGPFSMAAKIYPQDKLLLEVMLDPDGIEQLLSFCTETILVYIKHCLKSNIAVSLFDSFASPPLISPEVYRDLVLPFHQNIFDHLRIHNIPIRPLVMGGNSNLLMDILSQTGANFFVLDYNVSDDEKEAILKEYPFGFRINLNPQLFFKTNHADIESEINSIQEKFSQYKNAVIGTGVLPWDTPLENLELVRSLIETDF